jgi:Tfp pilus assembly protein PilP
MIKLVVVSLILFKLTVSWAQGTAGSGLSPAEMNEFKNNLIEMEAKKNEELRKEKQQQKKFVFPSPGNSAALTPEAAPAQAPMQAPMQALSANPALPAGATGSELRSANIKPDAIPPNSGLRVKSPFMIPNELYIKIKKKIGEKPNTIDIDEAIEVRLRWPLKDYKLVGVIYDTKKPKALIADRQGKVHVYREKELIANAGGYLVEINNGEVIVVEKGAEVKLQLKEK